jgi:hypothetical protein
MLTRPRLKVTSSSSILAITAYDTDIGLLSHSTNFDIVILKPRRLSSHFHEGISLSQKHRESAPIKMSDPNKSGGSVKSSEYSGKSDSGKKAGEQVLIDPNKAKQAISSGDNVKRDREERKKNKGSKS